jgi:hypothetical protein
VTNVVVDASGTLITFDLTLAADAPAETRAVIVVTENGTARCNIASNPPAPPLVAAKLVRTGALFTVASTAFPPVRLRVLDQRPVRAGAPDGRHPRADGLADARPAGHGRHRAGVP